MTFDGSVLCTRGRGPSRVGVVVLAAEPELWVPQALKATAEAEAMRVRWSAVGRLKAVVASRWAARTGQPARIPLVVVTPEAPAAQGHIGGEAGTFSSGAGGDSVGEAVKEAVEKASEREGEDGENDSGEARQGGGESRSSPSPSTSRNSSTSLRRFRVLLAGGVVTSGEGGVGASPAGAATAEAAVHMGGVSSMLLPAVVAARTRRRRRRRRRWRLTTVASVADVVGRLHVTVTICIPAAWLKTTRALRTLARHRSHSAKNSAVGTTGCGLKQAGSPSLPLTTLAHVAVGEIREVAGREGAFSS
jgi:hypothetical protein